MHIKNSSLRGNRYQNVGNGMLSGGDGHTDKGGGRWPLVEAAVDAMIWYYVLNVD